MAVVVVFDFDKTIIDCDSDNWVVDELGLTPLFTQLLPTMPWNSLMVCFVSSIQIFFFFFLSFLFFSFFPKGCLHYCYNWVFWVMKILPFWVVCYYNNERLNSMLYIYFTG